MKAVIATLLCSVFISSIAHAGPAEENAYLAQKKAVTAKLKKTSEYGSDAEKKALKALIPTLRAAIGPTRFDNFGDTRLLSETLFEDEPGYSDIDGLYFTHDDDEVLVTTGRLLDRYLELRKKSERAKNNAPLQMKELVGDLYWDAEYRIVADLPLAQRSGVSVYATVGNWEQDSYIAPPRFIGMVVRQGNLAYIASVMIKTPVPEIKKCKTSSTDGDEGKYDRCWAAEFAKSPGFNGVKVQAEALLDRMVGTN